MPTHPGDFSFEYCFFCGVLTYWTYYIIMIMKRILFAVYYFIKRQLPYYL